MNDEQFVQANQGTQNLSGDETQEGFDCSAVQVDQSRASADTTQLQEAESTLQAVESQLQAVEAS